MDLRLGLQQPQPETFNVLSLKVEVLSTTDA